MAVIFAVGIAAGLLGSSTSTAACSATSGTGTWRHPQSLTLAIATGLGLHNLSEGLAIGESAHVGAIAFTGVLAVGFALHNITEGFGIAAPMTTESKPASWRFLGIAGLIGGGPTFIGTWIGYLANSSYFSIAFLAVAAALSSTSSTSSSTSAGGSAPDDVCLGSAPGFPDGLRDRPLLDGRERSLAGYRAVVLALWIEVMPIGITPSEKALLDLE